MPDRNQGPKILGLITLIELNGLCWDQLKSGTIQDMMLSVKDYQALHNSIAEVVMSETFKESWQRNIKSIPFQRALIFLTSIGVAIILIIIERI